MRLLLLLCVLFAGTLSAAAARQTDTDYDSIVVDATYVPCSDSTESLLVFRSGRAIYAYGDHGVVFTLTTAILDDMVATALRAQSIVDTTHLDSCTTVGVILGGNRFLLINNQHPTTETRDIQLRLERLRRFAKRKLSETVDPLAERASITLDTMVMANGPSVGIYELRRHIRISPVAIEWKCRGSVIIRVLVGKDGDARRAFVHEVRVRGKCGSLLVTAALQAVLRSTFHPAMRRNGQATHAWTDVEVHFARK